jgi:hypothetical protein
MLKPLSVLLGFAFMACTDTAPDQGEATDNVDHRPGLEGDTALDADSPADTASHPSYDNKSGAPPPAPH